MLLLVVPALGNFLLEPTKVRSAGVCAQKLHEVSLNKLTKIGPQYPNVS